MAWLLAVLFIAAAYYGSAKLGLSLAQAADQVTGVWPPTGISLAAVLLLGYRIWPGIALGAFLANVTTQEPVGVAAGISAGNTLEAVAGAWLLKNVAQFDCSLQRLRDVLALVAFGALLSTMVSATIGVTSLCLGQLRPWTEFVPLWLEWWLGDAMSNLVVAPALLAWLGNPRAPTGEKWLEWGTLMVSTLATTALVFLSVRTTGHAAYAVFPFVVWAALRFEQRGTSLVTLLVVTVAVWGTWQGSGPFSQGPIEERLLRWQVFTGVVAITALLLGAALTERRRAEESKRQAEDSLRANAQRTQQIVETAYDAFVAMDERGRIMEWNERAVALFGWSVEEALGQVLADLIIPRRYRDAHERGLQKFLVTGEGPVLGHPIELPALHRSGREIPVELMVSAIQSDSGYFFSAFLHDITDRKRTEDTFRFLAEASASLAALVDYESTLQNVARLSLGFFADWCLVDTLAPDGSLHRVATAHSDPEKVREADRLYACYPGDLRTGWGTCDVLQTHQSELIADLNEASLRKQARNDQHYEMLSALGLKSILRIPLLVRGKPFGVITFATAESNRRYTAADLKIAEDVVHRAAVAIDNAQLYAEVRQADRRKDEFLAMLAHELRNPLAPIRSGLDLLRLQGNDPETTAWVHETMNQQVSHMVRLVDDLLDVSRIMRGRVQLKLEPVDIRTIIARAVEVARPLIDAQGHALTVEVPAAPIRLRADPVRLTQVIANLLNNAAKYTDQGGKIGVSAAMCEDELIIEVIDTGIGLTPEMQQRVFDLFAQADHSVERTRGGLGIGLTLARTLVELHGGRIEVASDGLGKGSRFTVRLPVRAGRHADEASPEGAGKDAAVPSKILVVDDNQDAAAMVGRLLELWGHTVRIVHDGRAAVDAAANFHPDIVLLDIGLPGMNGYDVARTLRTQPGGAQLRIVALTGYGQQEDRQRSLEAGFDAHLVKPLAQDDLRRAIAAHPPAPLGQTT